jgi:hypothetical protein
VKNVKRLVEQRLAQLEHIIVESRKRLADAEQDKASEEYLLTELYAERKELQQYLGDRKKLEGFDSKASIIEGYYEEVDV